MEPTQQPIPQPQAGPVQEAPKSLEEMLMERRSTWNAYVSSLGEKINKIQDLPDLLNTVYSARQDASEQYFYMLDKYAARNKGYKKKRAEAYNIYKAGKNLRYGSDAAINGQIDADLCDEIYELTLIANHADYMKETVKTIDDIIYAINNRIRLEELIRGVK